MFWLPKWKKQAKLVLKGSQKFINFKRDLIDAEGMETIKSAQQAVKNALRDNDKDLTKKKCTLLDKACKSSINNFTPTSWITENTESIFVAIAIALGIRAFFLQPFTIPTNSMQPTLNGIHSHIISQEDWPSAPVRFFHKFTHGRSYVSAISKLDDEITGLHEYRTKRFFTKTQIQFANQPPITISGSASSLIALNPKLERLFQQDPKNQKNTLPIKANEVIAEGVIDAGDMVLVDKFSYHFRKPKRGETFVFDTRNIEQIHRKLSKIGQQDGKLVTQFTEQLGGAHYIKRCVGVPGDVISLDGNGAILINGEIATDAGLQYAMALTGFKRPENFKGYLLANDSFQLQLEYPNLINSPEKKIVLAGEDQKQFAEYAAFGDNTANSSDSRYWGKVKEYNLVGPAFFSLWPFKHEVNQHWGFIK